MEHLRKQNEFFETFKVCPIEDPRTYPGEWPEKSFLYFYTTTDQSSIPGYKLLYIQLERNRKLIHSKISMNNYYYNLDRFLRRNNQAVLSERFPILTYGSNACPRQLFFKGITGAIPFFKASLKGFDIVYSAHISEYGYIPATIMESERTTIEVWVALVNEAQLKMIDKSEDRPRTYDLVKINLDGENTRIVLENGEMLPFVYTYISKKGFLAFNGQPISLKAIKARDRRYQELDEKEVLSIILNHAKNESDIINAMLQSEDILEDFVNIIKKKRSRNVVSEKYEKQNYDVAEFLSILRDLIKRNFIGVYSIKGNPLYELVALDKVPKTYFVMETDFLNPPSDPSYLKVLPTRERGNAKGDYIIRVNERTARELGFCNCIFHRMIRGIGFPEFIVIMNEVERREFANFGKLLIDNKVADKCAEVDLSLRHSVGIYRYEYARFYKAKATLGWRIKHFLANLFGIQYSICRVRRGDLPDVEKRICRAEKQVLDDIGVSNGDFCVIESVKKDSNNNAWMIKSLRIRVLELYPYVRAKRKSLQAPSFNARFPDCADLLDMTPDLAWIFLDEHARQFLGAKPCGAVKIRRSIVHEFKKRLSEFAFIVLITLLGTVLTYREADVTRIGIFSMNTLWLIFLITMFAFILICLEIRGKIA